MLPNFRQGIAFLMFPSIVRVSFGRSNIYPQMKTSREQWLNYNDRGKHQCSEEKLSNCCRVHHTSPDIEPSATLPAKLEPIGFICYCSTEALNKNRLFPHLQYELRPDGSTSNYQAYSFSIHLNIILPFTHSSRYWRFLEFRPRIIQREDECLPQV